MTVCDAEYELTLVLKVAESSYFLLLFDLDLLDVARTQSCITRRRGMLDRVGFAFHLNEILSTEDIGRSFGLERVTVDRTGIAFCKLI